MGKNLIRRILKEGEFDWAGEAESPLVIGDPKVAPKNPTNTVLVTVNWMSGDADAFNEETTDFNLDDPEQYSYFMAFMKAIKWQQSYGTRTNGRYGTLVPNMWEYVRNWGEWREQMRRKLNDDEVEQVRDIWNHDVFSDGDGPADPDSVSFIYYDPSGVERQVSLDWSKINIDG